MWFLQRDDHELLFESDDLDVVQIKLLGLNGDKWEPLFKPATTLEEELLVFRRSHLSSPGETKPRVKKKETDEHREGEGSMDGEWYEASPERCMRHRQIQMARLSSDSIWFVFEPAPGSVKLLEKSTSVPCHSTWVFEPVGPGFFEQTILREMWRSYDGGIADRLSASFVSP